MKRLTTRWIPALVVVVAIVAAGVVFNPLSIFGTDETAAGQAPRDTTEVGVSDLVSTFEAESGSIDYLGQQTITGVQTGTIGWIAEPDSEIEIGQTLYERDLQPVVLLEGEIPAWRTMSEGDVGQDVAQLEQNLEALGYGDADDFTVDDTYTSATEVIVSRWQADLGVAETGTVAHGDVVFGPSSSRVGSVLAAVGDQSANTPILTLSGPERELTFTVTAETVGSVEPGTQIRARLPDRSTVAGTVQAVTPAGTGISTVRAEIDDEPETLPTGESIPVTVTWDATAVADAATVPASALLRLDSGGYGLEVVASDGSTELVAVVPGARVGSTVQILDGVEPGTEVIAP